MATDQPRRRRHSAAVYRRRRLTLLVLIVVIGVAIWLMIAQPWRGAASENAHGAGSSQDQDAATSIPVPSTVPTPGATSSTPPEGETEADEETDAGAQPSSEPTTTLAAEACLPRDVTVEAVTDRQTYASGQNPQLSIRLTNDGETDCTLNVGTSSQVFTITSGSDVWWRSTDCQSEPSDMVVLLTAGQTVTSAAPLTWDRTRSSASTCENADRPRAPGGGASYHLTVEIGGIASTDSAQILLY